MDEKQFYSRLRKAAINAGFIPGRVENAVDEGWPDVLLRGDNNFHAWVELKVTNGPRAKIKVRPEQINWIEEHANRGGVVHLLAWNRHNPGQFWCVSPERVRFCAKQGCLSQPCYAVRHLGMLFLRWSGSYVNIQSQNPTLAKERSSVAFTPKRVVVTRAAMQILRRDGSGDAGRHRGPHHTEGAWWDSR